MKEILISIRPQWVEKILNGEKTIEIRKTMPKCELPVKVYIYVTKNKSWGDKLIYVTDPLNVIDPFYELGYKFNSIPKVNGKVVAEFTLNKVKKHKFNFIYEHPITNEEILDYYITIGEMEKIGFDNSPDLSDFLEIYGKGKTLYAWHISDLKIYDKPRELGEFWVKRKCTTCFDTGYESSACVFDEDCMRPTPLTKAPQSWCYVEGL